MSIVVSLADAANVWLLRDSARTQRKLDVIEDAILAGPGTPEWERLLTEEFANCETIEEQQRNPITRRRTGVEAARAVDGARVSDLIRSTVIKAAHAADPGNMETLLDLEVALNAFERACRLAAGGAR